VDFKKLTPDMVSGSVIVITIALAARFLATMLVVSGESRWHWKEKLFAGFSWCPKATVQAALWWVFDSCMHLLSLHRLIPSPIPSTHLYHRPYHRPHTIDSPIPPPACTDLPKPPPASILPISPPSCSSVALDYVNDHKDQFTAPGSLHENTELANIILTVAVLSILMTAPLFGAIMSWWGLTHLERVAVDGANEGGYNEGLLTKYEERGTFAAMQGDVNTA
jgi:hypothetical protein